MKASVQCKRKDKDEAIEKSVKLFTVVVTSIHRSQAELIELIKKKQKAAEKQDEELIKELEEEITELQRRSTELELLSHNEDHLHLIQSFPSSSIPHTKDWTDTTVCSILYAETVKKAMAQLEKTLKTQMSTLLIHLKMVQEDLRKLPEAVNLGKIQPYAGYATFDPKPVHPNPSLPDDEEQLRRSYKIQSVSHSPIQSIPSFLHFEVRRKEKSGI
ncbi:hypothetical protein LDENG_00126000 [Lucifuga dentata]|nr:hypothetical protein LDENG_00126000 [Lucifuga dentata]